MSDTKLYILGYPGEFRGNHWKRDIENAARRLGWNVVHRAAQAADTEEVLRECKDADLFLWLRTHRNDPHGDAWDMLRRIEDAGVPTVGLHMDLYWDIEYREALINTRQYPWWSCQRVYTADGGHQAEFAERGVNHFWMPPGFGSENLGLHLQRSKRFKRLYIFVGSNSKKIHGPHRTSLLHWASKTYGRDFHQYGSHNKVYGQMLNELYGNARVVLGDSAPAEFYWSDRIPTTLGRGGVLAYPRTSGLWEQGFNDSNMLLFDRFDFDGLGMKIARLSDAEIMDMREAAVSVIEERHMWAQRLVQIRNEVVPA